MINVTSLSEPVYLTIMWIQIVLIIISVLRLGRFALYIIRKNDKKFIELVNSLSQLLYPSIYLFVGIFKYCHISFILLILITINLSIKPSIDIITKSDNNRYILFIKMYYFILLTLLLMELIKIMLEK